MVVDLAGWPRFFVEAAMGRAGQLYFRFIGVSVIGVGLGKADSLTIGGAVLTGADVTVDFSRLCLW